MGNQTSLGDLIDVAFKGQHGDICVEAPDDGTGLGAGGAIGTAHPHVLAGLLFPMPLEGGDDVSFVRFLRDAIGREYELARVSGLKRNRPQREDRDSDPGMPRAGSRVL